MTQRKQRIFYVTSSDRKGEPVPTLARSIEGAQRSAQEKFGVGKSTVLYVIHIEDNVRTVYEKKYRQQWQFSYREAL